MKTVVVAAMASMVLAAGPDLLRVEGFRVELTNLDLDDAGHVGRDGVRLIVLAWRPACGGTAQPLPAGRMPPNADGGSAT